MGAILGLIFVLVVVVALAIALAPYLLPIVGWGLLAILALVVVVMVPLYLFAGGFYVVVRLWRFMSPMLPEKWRAPVLSTEAPTPSP